MKPEIREICSLGMAVDAEHAAHENWDLVRLVAAVPSPYRDA
jgi:hypothetical protein